MSNHDALSSEIIIAAYRGGYFPMPDPDSGEIMWFNPDPRTIIPLDQFHVSRSLRRKVKHENFTITFDRDFRGVINGCANRDPTWISDEIKMAYIRLFELGVGHSVEVWNKSGQLVGGLYGLSQGAVFNAESMFSRETDASKTALWALTKFMKESGFTLLEVQFMTEHLASLGAVEVSRATYMRQLGVALANNVQFTSPSGLYNLL